MVFLDATGAPLSAFAVSCVREFHFRLPHKLRIDCGNNVGCSPLNTARCTTKMSRTTQMIVSPMNQKQRTNSVRLSRAKDPRRHSRTE